MNHRKNVHQQQQYKVCKRWHPLPPAPPPLAKHPSPEDICCPVCQTPLSRTPRPRTDVIDGYGFAEAAMRNEIRDLRSGKVRDVDLVVASPCAHLFHKFCLRHYCFIYQRANNVQNVECPICLRRLSMIRYHNIDFKSHLEPPIKFEKHYKETAFIQQELIDQVRKALTQLENVANSIADASMKLNAYRSHQASLQASLLAKEQARKDAIEERYRLRYEIKKCNEEIDYMHKENLNILKIYLSIMKDQPEAKLREKRIPQPLIPYLSIILGDEKLVKKFGQVLKPIKIKGFRNNTELLIKEILADVGAKNKSMRYRGKKSVKFSTQHSILKKPMGKPVVVKVQRSNVSIFSRTDLDQESLRTILHQVKGPINKLHDTHHKLTSVQRKGRNTKKLKLGGRGGRPLLPDRSASDIIQVLLEPRKNKVYDTSLVSPMDSHLNFVQSEEKSVPQRRCKSTEPILVRVAKGKNNLPAMVVVKVNELNKQHHHEEKRMGNNAVGDERAEKEEAVNTKPEVNKELAASSNVELQTVSLSSNKEAPSTKSVQTSFQQEAGKNTVKINERISRILDFQQKQESSNPNSRRDGKVFQFQEEEEEGRNSSAGFTPNVSDSVYEMIYEEEDDGTSRFNADDDRDRNPLTSLVDDVSKITFGTFKRILCQNPRVDGNGNVKQQPLIEYSVQQHSNKVTTSTNTDNVNINLIEDFATQKGKGSQSKKDDIESAWRESESNHDNNNNSTTNTSERNSSQQNGRGMTSGMLQGILPGPYLDPVLEAKRGQQEISYMTRKVPIYQSKWLTKLPSTRTEQCIPNNNACTSNMPTTNLIPPAEQYQNYEIVQNQPFGDTGGQHTECGDITSSSCRKHTVIDIPSSSSSIMRMMTRFPRPLRNSGHHRYQSEFMERSISPIHLNSSMSQRALYNRNNSFATLDNRLNRQQEQQISSRCGVLYNSPLAQCRRRPQEQFRPQHPPLHSLEPYQQQFGHNNHYHPANGEHFCSTRSPNSFEGNAHQIPPRMAMENALVELCRGLSPPTRHSRHGMLIHDQCCYEFDDRNQNHNFRGSVIRRNRNYQQQQASAMLMCPDGISPRIVRKAKRRQQVSNV